MSTGSASLIILITAAAAPLQSQQFRIALNITEREGSTVTSQLGAGLRTLGDVVVVTPEEPHDYRLDGIVMCSPRETCSVYVVALQFSEPFDADISGRVLSTFVSRAGRLSVKQDSALKATLRQQTADYYKSLYSWVARWPQASVAASVTQLVAEIDQGCLERERMHRRMTDLFVRGDTVAGNALGDKLFQKPIPDNVICV